MFIRSVRDILGTDRDVAGEGWKSRRLVLARDGLSYSVHETIVAANTTLRFAYRAHRETVYCISGTGTISNLATGEVRPLEPGTLYTAGVGDDHRVATQSEVKFLCIFDPPLAGAEEAD
jgi:L-ectoine synthase